MLHNTLWRSEDLLMESVLSILPSWGSAHRREDIGTRFYLLSSLTGSLFPGSADKVEEES